MFLVCEAYPMSRCMVFNHASQGGQSFRQEILFSCFYRVYSVRHVGVCGGGEEPCIHLLNPASFTAEYAGNRSRGVFDIDAMRYSSDFAIHGRGYGIRMWTMKLPRPSSKGRRRGLLLACSVICHESFLNRSRAGGNGLPSCIMKPEKVEFSYSVMRPSGYLPSVA